MKDSLKYSDLWRKKREELPVDTEPQAGWQEMQTLLDLHLPIVPVAPAAPVSKLAKVIKAIKAMKATSLLVASLTVATVAGTTIYLLKNRQHTEESHQHKNNNQVVRKDSLREALNANTLNVGDSIDAVRDSSQSLSLSADKQHTSVNNNDSLSNASKTNSALNYSGVKTNGASSTSTIINGQRGVASARQVGNSNTINGSLSASTGRGQHRNTTFGRYQNSKNHNAAGNLAGQQVNINGIDTISNPDLPDNWSAQNGDPSAIALTPPFNGIQSWQTGPNSPLFQPQFFARRPLSSFVVGNYYYNRLRGLVNGKTLNSKNQKSKNQSSKTAKTKSSGRSFGKSLSAAFSNTDWGILLGANSSGSFTPAAQNHNFYGSSPIDIYTGLFATYHINDKWAVNTQVRFLTPLNLSGTYTNQNDHVDSVRSIKVTDSRKVYFVNIPIHAVYKITDNISIKGGPVINILAKQVSFNTSAQKIYDNVDTLFFQTKESQIKTTTRYAQKINLGLSGGISVQANRFIFEAVYQKSLSGYNVISDFHNYKNNPGTLQLSIGFKLNSSKHH